MPYDLQTVILERIASACGANANPRILFILECTCKSLRDLLADPQRKSIWEKGWESARQRYSNARREEKNLEKTGLTMTAKQKLKLAGCHGCMVCKTKFARTVDWEFETRCCPECFYENYVLESELLEEYGIPVSELREVDHVIETRGSRTHRIYWKPFVLPKLQKYREEIEEVDEEIDKRMAELS